MSTSTHSGHPEFNAPRDKPKQALLLFSHESRYRRIQVRGDRTEAPVTLEWNKHPRKKAKYT